MVQVPPLHEWVSGMKFGIETRGFWVSGSGLGGRVHFCEDERRCVSSAHSDSFLDSQKHFTIASSKTAWCQALQIHVQPNPYPCLCLFLKKKSMCIPPSPPSPRATITPGLGLISHIRRFRTFKSLKAFGAALRLPSQLPDIVRVSHHRGGHLTTPSYYKTHHICCWNSFQLRHRVLPSERSTSERLIFDTSSILQRASPWIQLYARCHKITLKI